MSKRVSTRVLIGRPRKTKVKKKISITLDQKAERLVNQMEPGDRSSKISLSIIHAAATKPELLFD